jgi:hypothetical protein
MDSTKQNTPTETEAAMQDINKVVKSGQIDDSHYYDLDLHDWLTHEDRMYWNNLGRRVNKSMTTINNAPYKWSK